MHNRGVEGKKQYILPVLAAAVLVVLLVARNRSGWGTEADPPASVDPPPQAPARSTKATIRDAVEAAGEPPLEEAAQRAVKAALAPIVSRCRSSRPEAAEQPVSVTLDVLAAEGIGVAIERDEVSANIEAGMLGCVREGMLGAKPAGIGETGRFSGTLEFEAP